MQTEITDLNSQISSLKDDLAELRQDNNDQENELAKKQGVIEHLVQRQPSESPAAHVPRIKTKALPDPEKFTGHKSTIPFDQWVMQVQDKLEVDKHLFDTEQRRIKYVGNCTSGDAYDYIWPKLADQEFADAKEVIQALTDIFDDPNKKLKAKQALAKLYQGNWDFHRYHAEFTKIARPLKLDDEDLKEELTSKLNEKYAMTVLSDDDLTYTQLVKKLHSVDRKLIASRNVNKPSFTSNTNKPQATNNQNNAGQATTSSNSEVRAPIRTREQFDALFAAGLCKKCCKPVHSKPGEKCGEKWAAMPMNIKAIAPKQVNKIDQVDVVELESSKN
jgi:hypothetical protein